MHTSLISSDTLSCHYDIGYITALCITLVSIQVQFLHCLSWILLWKVVVYLQWRHFQWYMVASPPEKLFSVSIKDDITVTCDPDCDMDVLCLYDTPKGGLILHRQMMCLNP